MIKLRSLQPNDNEAFIAILSDAFKGLEYLPRTRAALSSRHFNRTGSFIAEEDSSPTGTVALFNLLRDRWYEIRFLAVRDASHREGIASELAAKAVEFAESNQSEYLKATTLALQPYVDVYKNLGFKPVRRTLRVAWELSSVYPPPRSSITPLTLPKERFKEALAVFLDGLHPYWDWWIDEVGGPEAVTGLFQEPTENETWICIPSQEKMVGVAWLIRDFYGPGEARFQGVYVIPEARRGGIGSSLMHETISRAQQLGQKRMVIYTFSPVDHFAPGALLYLKSGGRTEAEYLQLQKL